MLVIIIRVTDEETETLVRLNTCSLVHSCSEAAEGFELRQSEPTLNHHTSKENQNMRVLSFVFTWFECQSELKLLFYL